MNNKITYEIYKDNPPPDSRPLKSQVSELRKEIQNMRLTDEEKEAIDRAISLELDAGYYGGPEPNRVVILRKLKERLS